MANKFIVFITLCCGCLAFSAQQVGKLDKTRFGVKGGVNMSKMHYSNLGDHDAGGITSGVGGIFAEFDLGTERKFSIRPEILFLSRGSEVDVIDVYGNDFGYKLKAKYTDIRIPVIYNFRNPEKISPYIYLAPIFSFTQKRAMDVYSYLIKKGVSFDRLSYSYLV